MLPLTIICHNFLNFNNIFSEIFPATYEFEKPKKSFWIIVQVENSKCQNTKSEMLMGVNMIG
jgi:hypothetical protein